MAEHDEPENTDPRLRISVDRSRSQQAVPPPPEIPLPDVALDAGVEVLFSGPDPAPPARARRSEPTGVSADLQQTPRSDTPPAERTVVAAPGSPVLPGQANVGPASIPGQGGLGATVAADPSAAALLHPIALDDITPTPVPSLAISDTSPVPGSPPATAVIPSAGTAPTAVEAAASTNPTPWVSSEPTPVPLGAGGAASYLGDDVQPPARQIRLLAGMAVVATVAAILGGVAIAKNGSGPPTTSVPPASVAPQPPGAVVVGGTLPGTTTGTPVGTMATDIPAIDPCPTTTTVPAAPVAYHDVPTVPKTTLSTQPPPPPPTTVVVTQPPPPTRTSPPPGQVTTVPRTNPPSVSLPPVTDTTTPPPESTTATSDPCGAPPA